MNKILSGVMFFGAFITLSVLAWHELAHEDYHWLVDLGNVSAAAFVCFAFGFIFMLLDDEID